jgi:hypothetical protein
MPPMTCFFKPSKESPARRGPGFLRLVLLNEKVGKGRVEFLFLLPRSKATAVDGPQRSLNGQKLVERLSRVLAT